MRLAIVIPTRNAVRRGKWESVLKSVARQDLAPERRIIIDSSSQDTTCAAATAAGWECRTIPKAQFNHGATRDRVVRELAAEGIDTVVFLSQDVILSASETLRRLTDYLWANPIAGCCGRQQGQQEGTLNAWQRKRCYPESSAVRTMQDVPISGLMTVFFSDAFAAWKTQDVLRYGGFPQTDFGEDTLLAAAILKQGGAIGYCAEAIAFHDHPNTPWQLFRRGMQVGGFHRRNPALLRDFGGKVIRSAGRVPFRIWPALAVKGAGYLFGRTFGK